MTAVPKCLGNAGAVRIGKSREENKNNRWGKYNEDVIGWP